MDKSKVTPLISISQTGTATYFSKLLSAFLHTQGYTIKESSSSVTLIQNLLKYDQQIIIISTAGDGDMPFQFKETWDILCKSSIPDNFLSSKIFILGLGDSVYEKFNFAARKLARRLEMIGADVCVVLGDLQDEQGYLTGLKGFLNVVGGCCVVETWFDFFEAVFGGCKLVDSGKLTCGNTIYKNKQEAVDKEQVVNVPSIQNKDCKNKTLKTVKFDQRVVKNTALKKVNLKDDEKFLSSKSFDCKITAKEIINTGYNEILKISITIDLNNYTPGDALSINPKNYNATEFMNHNNYNPDFVVTFDGDQHTLRDIVESEIDFNCIPPQPIFYFLYNAYRKSHFGDLNKSKRKELNENESNLWELENKNELKPMDLKNENILKPMDLKNENIYSQKLKDFLTNYDDYFYYVVQPKRTLFEVMKEFNIKMDIDSLFWLPKITPRYYTIVKVDEHYEFTVSLVKFDTILKNRVGLCSEYLRKMAIMDVFEARVQKGYLRFTDKNLFICTGAGITVPRAYNSIFKDPIVFYGHRNSKDALYLDEFDHVYECSSREGERMYVQTLFRNIVRDLNDKHNNDKCNIEPYGKKHNHLFINIKEYNIIVSGKYQLNREVKKLFKQLYHYDVNFQSETW